MTKLRKQRRKKQFRHSVNRKRLRNKLYAVGDIACKEIKEQWEQHVSVQTNLDEMGLSYDPNKTIKIPNTKKQIQASIQSNLNSDWHEETTAVPRTKISVSEALWKEAKAPRAKMFRLSKGVVEYASYLMDTYGKDYRAMTRDKRNYNQETWKQLRAKIKKFKSIPEQYSVYLEKRGLEADTDEDVSSDGEL